MQLTMYPAAVDSVIGSLIRYLFWSSYISWNVAIWGGGEGGGGGGEGHDLPAAHCVMLTNLKTVQSKQAYEFYYNFFIHI